MPVEKPTLREEFRLWWQAAPRVWVIISAVILFAFIFRETLNAIAAVAFFVLLIFLLVSIIPAVVGALAGKLVGRIIRRVRYPKDLGGSRCVPLVLPRRRSML